MYGPSKAVLYVDMGICVLRTDAVLEPFNALRYH